MKYFLYCLKHYADFEGRARRSEFWYYTLFHFSSSFYPYLLVLFYYLRVGLFKTIQPLGHPLHLLYLVLCYRLSVSLLLSDYWSPLGL